MLGVGVDEVVVMVPGDGQHRLTIHLGVIEPVQKVHPSRSGGRQAHPQPAGIFGIGTGHEGCRFLMTHLNKADLILARAQRLHNAVDAITRQTEDDVDAPVIDRVDQDICGGIRRGESSLVVYGMDASCARGCASRCTCLPGGPNIDQCEPALLVVRALQVMR